MHLPAGLCERCKYLSQVGFIGHIDRHERQRVFLRVVDRFCYLPVPENVESSIRVADPSRTELNAFNHTFRGSGLDGVSHQICVLEQNEEAGYNVIDQRLSAESDNKAKNPRA